MNTEKLQQTAFFNLVMAFLLSLSAVAQVAGDLDIPFVPQGNFTSGAGFDGEVRLTASQPDGKILVSGTFNSFNGTPCNPLVRLNEDGTLDTSFTTGSGFNSSVLAMAVQPDGKILVGGYFASYNGNPAYRLARLNADGTFDSSFDAGNIFNEAGFLVSVIAIQTNGKIVVGGDFYEIIYSEGNANVINSRLLRLNEDGSLDTSFNPTGAGLAGVGNIPVYAIALQPDGKIVIGGDFESYNGTASPKIARINTNGTFDTSFNSGGAGFNYDFATVYSIALQTDGKIVLGGFLFLQYNGTTINNGVVRLNANGTLDTAFNAGGTGLNNAECNSVIVLPDGRIVAGGGTFTSYNGTTTNRIVCLNPDGTPDDSFFNAEGFNESVRTISLQPDGKVVIGGDFTVYNGQVNNRIIRLESNGDVQSGFNNEVLSIVLQDDGKILAGGAFTSYNSNNNTHLIRLNEDGEKDTTFADAGFNNNVTSINVQTDGKILTGGNFTTFNGQPKNRLMRLNSDGTMDNSLNIGTGFNEKISLILLQPDGKIIAAGDFTTYNGQNRNRIIRLNSNGTVDNSLNIGTGFNSVVLDMVLQSDGKILIAGEFTSYNGQNCNKLVRLNSNGTLDTSFNTGTGFDNLVHSVALQLDGKIVVGGDFIFYNGQARFRIARLNADGTLDPTFNTGTGFDGSVRKIVLQSNGRIFAGGDFTTFNNQSFGGFVALLPDGTIDGIFNFGNGFNSTVKSIVVQQDSKILAGGNFMQYDGLIGRYLVRLHGDDNQLSIDNPVLQSSIDIKAYPNPVNNVLHLSSQKAINSILVTDLSGRAIYENNYNQMDVNVNFSDFPQGIYLVKATVGNHTKVIKINKK